LAAVLGDRSWRAQGRRVGSSRTGRRNNNQLESTA
jgi:hypothetical protein